MVHQDEITTASRRASMRVRAIVEPWARELTEGDVRELIRVVWKVVEKDPSCVEAVQGIDMRPYSLSEARRFAADWLGDSDSDSDEQRLTRAAMVTLDTGAFAAGLKRLGIAIPVCLGGAPREDAPAWHSPDYRRVRWYGTEHTFNEGQASVVEALWYDWESRGAGLGEAWLLDVIEPFRPDRKNPRLQDSFGGGKRAKQHKAWGTMIQRVGRKTYALVEPKK